MQFNVSANRVMNSYGLLSCHCIRGEPSVGKLGGLGESGKKKTHLHHWGKRKTWGETKDRGMGDSGRRHQNREREVRFCHYPWEDRCGPRLRLTFTGSHLETALTSPTRDGTFASIHRRVHAWGHTLRRMYLYARVQRHLYEHAAGVKQTNYAVMLQLNWTLEGRLKWIMNTIIFPFILDLLVPASASNTDITPAIGLSQSVPTTLLAQPKSFPLQTELQGNKGAGKGREKKR